MDNASKALIFAGGILIAVLVISVSMYVIASARGVAKTSNERLEANAIESFNRFYKAYGALPNNSYEVKGIDALNIYRKAVDDSSRDAHVHVINTDDVSDIGDLSADVDDGSVTGAENYNAIYEFSYTVDALGYINKISFEKKD